MKKLNFLLPAISLILILGCRGSADEPVPVVQPDTAVKTGKISGNVMAKNGTKPIGGALVFTFDQNEKIYYTYSDENGHFIMDAPAGQRTVHIQTGTGDNFRTEFTATITAGQTTNFAANQTVLNQVAKMAYVKGTYDEIEDIVTGLGYNITMITNADLANINEVKKYDIIFLNCGSRTGITTAQSTVIDGVLSNFVSNGGSLYASDWDVAYLTGGMSNSSACGLAGGFINDSLLCSKTIGQATTLNNCTVSNPALAAATGFSTLNISYDMGMWERIQNYDSNFWDVLVQKDQEALMIRTNKYDDPNAPVIPVGNDAADGYVTICHNPTGTNPLTITVSQSAWAAHQAHGDSLGPCSGVPSAGNIYYTTFHNHASGNIGNSGLILQYVILNL